MAFKDFKKNRSKSTELLTKKLESLNTTQSFEDARFWQPTVDKAGNGSAVLRFLPAKDGEDIPFVRIHSHAFKGPGGWLIEPCLTTKNEKCPVCEENTILWNTGLADNKAIVSGATDRPGRKRKLTYISNILVITDKEHPENNGKVFLYKYGAKIFEKIEDAGNVEFEDDVAIVNPFDMWEGANFKLRIGNVEGYRSYAKSSFDKASQIAQTDEEMEKIYNSLYSLQEFIADNKFKSYGEIRARFNKVTGCAPATTTSEVETPAPVREEKPAGKTRKPRAASAKEADSAPFDTTDDSNDDVMAKFRELAEA